MNQFALAKLVIDALFVATVVYLAIRSLKGQGTGVGMSGAAAREMRDLEISLKTLLRDADVSSQGLNSSLSRQQRNLEQLLADISSTEKRIGEVIDSANQTASRIRQQTPQAGYQQTTPTMPSMMARGDMNSLSTEDELIEEVQPVKTKRIVPSAVSSKASSKVNVFGEPISASAIDPETASADLSTKENALNGNQASRAVSTHSLTSSPSSQTISAPTGANQINRSEKTKAPIYRQQRLAQQIEIERAVDSVKQAKQVMSSLSDAGDEFTADVPPNVSASSDRIDLHEGSNAQASKAMSTPADEQSAQSVVIERDARLGVLGTVRRHTQVL